MTDNAKAFQFHRHDGIYVHPGVDHGTVGIGTEAEAVSWLSHLNSARVLNQFEAREVRYPKGSRGFKLGDALNEARAAIRDTTAATRRTLHHGHG